MNEELIKDLTKLLSEVIMFTLSNLPENLNISALSMLEVKETLTVNLTKQFYNEFLENNKEE